MTSIVFDAAAYRALTRDTDVAAARDVARTLADAERSRDARAVASPFALWSLLADVAAALAKPAKGAPSEQAHARAARARVALAACAVHCAKEPGPPGAPPFVPIGEPESR